MPILKTKLIMQIFRPIIQYLLNWKKYHAVHSRPLLHNVIFQQSGFLNELMDNIKTCAYVMDLPLPELNNLI